MSILNKVRYIFTKDQKIKFALLFFLILIGALFETLGVALIMPFISIVSSPDSIMSQPILKYFYDLLEIDSANSYLILLAAILIFVYIAKNIFLYVMYKLQFRFVYNNQMRLSAKLMDCYLRKPYEYHVNKNSSEIVRSITTDVSQLFLLVLNLILLLTEVMVVICIGIVLVFVEPLMTIITVGLILIVLCIFIFVYRKTLKQSGKSNQINNGLMIKWINQALGGIKEIKVATRENFFIESYSKASMKYAESQRKVSFLSQIPKLFIESICICSILIIISYFLYSGRDMSNMLPQLAAFAMAAFRIMPSFSRLTQFYNQIMFYIPSIDLVYSDLKESEIKKEVSKENNLKIQLKEDSKIKISNISYKYSNSSNYVLKDTTFEIPINKSTAFIGISGSGKTTFADILLGLLLPTEGKITVNGINIHDNKHEWATKIGYIPQNIFLCDDTIKNNVALGIKEEEIDEERVLISLEKSQLKDFVLSLQNGINTEIGERGVRLSGGQRQRIGIARAFYNDPEVFILDEATSSLDNDTEAAVMEAINSIKNDKTLIIIAHRLSTIVNCDLIFKVENGKVNQTEL